MPVWVFWNAACYRSRKWRWSSSDSTHRSMFFALGSIIPLTHNLLHKPPQTSTGGCKPALSTPPASVPPPVREDPDSLRSFMEAARLRAERQENSGQGSSTKFTFDPTSRVRIFSVSIMISSSSLLTSEMAMADPWSAMDQTNQPVRPSQEAKNGDCLPVRL